MTLHKFLSEISCVLYLSILLGSATMAAEIKVEDGTVIERAGEEPSFEGGQNKFQFQFHPVKRVDASEFDPQNLLFNDPDATDKNLRPSAPINLDPVAMFIEYQGIGIQEAPGFEALMVQSARGGLAASFSDMVLTEIAVLAKNCIVNGAPDDEAIIEPVYSGMRLHTNSIRTNAVFSVYSHKKILCIVNGELKEIPLKRRWVISVLGGLEEADIIKDIDGNIMTYKMFAKGKKIRLMAYYSNLTLTGPRWQNNMRLISGFDQHGNVDPRFNYYMPIDASCIDIDFKNKPHNDWLIISQPSDMRFCARGCVPGDISATK